MVGAAVLCTHTSYQMQTRINKTLKNANIPEVRSALADSPYEIIGEPEAHKA